MIEITEAVLVKLKACRSGIDDLLSVFPDGLHSDGWDATQQIGVLTHPQMRKWWGWCVIEGLIPMWSMAGWSMSEVDLSGADLRRANLRRANLRRATGHTQ